MVYVPEVAGAVRPLMRYPPVEPVVVPDIVTGEVAVNVTGMLPTVAPVTVSVRVPDTLYVPPVASDDGKRESVSEVGWASVLYEPNADADEYVVVPAKLAVTCKLFPTVLGAGPVTENAPLEFVITDERPEEPLPLKVIVMPPMPVPEAVSWPDTVKLLPQAGLLIEFSVSVVGDVPTVRTCPVELDWE